MSSTDIDLAALHSLLGVLRPYISDLPKSCRQLFSTPKRTRSVCLSNREYSDFALEDGLHHTVQIWPAASLGTSAIEVSFKFDEPSLFHSSSKQD